MFGTNPGRLKPGTSQNKVAVKRKERFGGEGDSNKWRKDSTELVKN